MIETPSATICAQVCRIRLFFSFLPDLQLTMAFQTDLAMVEELLDWVEWRVQVLKDDPILMEMIRVVKADPVGLRDKYQSNAEEHSMIEESKEYGRVFFGGVGNTLITNQWDTFECSKPGKIGDLLEGLLYYGLLVDDRGKSIAIECFFLARDMHRAFKITQRYGWWTSPNYRLQDLLVSVEKMRCMRLGHASAQPALTWWVGACLLNWCKPCQISQITSYSPIYNT